MHSDIMAHKNSRRWSFLTISCLAFILITVLSFSLLGTGCKSSEPKAQLAKFQINADGSYDVIDISGYKLHFAHPPKRVVTLTTSSTEIVLDLLPPERIAALCIYADDPGISCVVEKAKRVSNRVRANDVELLLKLKPDLILAPSWLGNEILASMRDMKLPVFVYNEPVTIEEIANNVLFVSKLVREENKGQQIVDDMQKRLQNVKGAVNKVPKKQQVKLVALSYMGAFGSKGTTFYDMCKYVNVFNCVGEAGISDKENVSKEMIVTMNPDVLLIPSWNFGEIQKGAEFKKNIMHDHAYREIRAVKDNRVYQIQDKYIYSTSHYVINGIEDMAADIYPQYYSKGK